MPDETSQQLNTSVPANALTPEEAKAALGLATRLSEDLLPKSPQEEQEETPEQGIDTVQEENNVKLADLEAKFDEFKKETEKTIEDKIGELKETIQEALEDGE